MAATAAHAGSARFSTPLAMSLAGLGSLAAQTSKAANASAPYKALVCLFMAGGNDSHNWLVPIDSASHTAYRKARQDLAWPTAKLQALPGGGPGGGRLFGMPLELEPLRTLYATGQCAWVANVGAMSRPINKADYLAGRDVPYKLFSHNDQASVWQSLEPEGAQSGWGGQIGDLLMSGNQLPAFTSVSATGNSVFLVGKQVAPYQLGASGPVAINPLKGTSIFGSAHSAELLRQVLALEGRYAHQQEYAKANSRALQALGELQAAFAATPVPLLPTTGIVLPDGRTLQLNQDSLALQLRLVAQMIAAAPRLGLQRQVFMVSIGGFDTHASQMNVQPLLMARVAQSIAWFMRTLAGQGMQNNVTLFTASDFGRTLTSNGQGSDHGWGSHHLVVGGAVKGGRIYGRVPEATLGTADDVGSGRMLPSIGITPYAATMARWMGLSDTDVRVVFPDAAAHPSTSLGFV